jgi:hypothetical protein
VGGKLLYNREEKELMLEVGINFLLSPFLWDRDKTSHAAVRFRYEDFVFCCHGRLSFGGENF